MKATIRRLFNFLIKYSIRVNELEYPREITIKATDGDDAQDRLKNKMGTTVYDVTSIEKV